MCLRNLVLILFAVLRSAAVDAGGYVPPNGTLLSQATSIRVEGTSSLLPTFDNAALTDQITVAQTNNDAIKAPLTSDPISTVTGNNVHDETDFVIKGRAGLDYAFTRTYNSAPSSTRVDFGLGHGWTHSYGMRLNSNDYGECPNCSSAQAAENGNGKTSSITYTDERGGDHNYLVDESSFAITAPQGEFDTLSLDAPSPGQHTLTFRNGVKYIFESPGGALRSTPGVSARLKQIVDPWGNQLNFSYNGNGRLAAVTDNLGVSGRSGLVFTYDASLHLQSVADWSGRIWTYHVDAAENLVSVTNPLTHTLTYGYTPGTHNLVSVAKPLRGVATAFVYYQNGRAFTNRDALGNGETLDYDLYSKRTRVSDARGGVRNFEYDGSGRLTSLTEADGAILQFQSQADGLRYGKNDGLGYRTQYSYRSDKSFNTASDTFGNVTREQDALGQTVDTTYGPFDQIATVKDKRGSLVTTSFHGSSGSCAASGKPAEQTLSSLGGATNVKLRSYCWNNDGTLASLTEYLSPTDAGKTRVSTYSYDASHLNVESVTVSSWDGASTTASYTWDILGRKKTETLPRRTSPTNAAAVNLTTAYDYDKLDRLIMTTDARGSEAINRYDANGQLWQVTHRYKRNDGSFDTRNVVTRTFDAADRVLTETDAASGVTAYSYDEAGNVITVTDAEKHTVEYQYDAMNRRTQATDANGRTVRTDYDQAGRAIAVTNGAGETTATAYDALGRPLSVTDAQGFITEFRYDANGNLTCLIDANANAGLQPKNADGCTVSTQYDELNRAVLTRDALDGVTRIAHDLLGNPVERIDAEGRRYTWAYDGLGRLASETDFAGALTSYQRDQAGNAWQVTNRLNEVTRATFDLLNRPTRIDYLMDGSSETFAYDAAGKLSSAANGTLAYTFEYDALNRLTEKLDSRGRSLAFSYDAAGNLLTKTTYQGSTTRYTYDGAGTLVAISNPDYLTVNYQYDAAGRLLSRVMSSGARSLYGYDAGGRLASLAHHDGVGATVTEQAYSRDRVGNITAITATAGPITGTTNYMLDALYRLTQVDAPNAANDEAFSYDRLGNRLIHTRGSATVGAAGAGIVSKYSIYTAATQTGSVSGYTPLYNHRLKEIRIGSASGSVESGFTFDAEGRLTSQTGSTPRTLTWDAKSRLKSLNGETYAYDPSDHRVGRSGGPLGTLDYYLEGEHLESVERLGTLTERYFRGSTVDELVAGYVEQGGKQVPYFFQHDHLMGVVAQTKPNGGSQATMAYRPFGEPLAATGTPVGRQRYTGREDDGTGLMYYRARYYDPGFGRFLSEDPLKFRAGQNFYAYVDNNPVNANDPTGLVRVEDSGDGRNVIAAHIVFFGPGANQDQARDWTQEISRSWSSNSNNTPIETIVTYEITNSVPDMSVYKNSHIVYVSDQNGRASQFVGGRTGQWPSPTTNPWTAAHEFGHVLGLPDRYMDVQVDGRTTSQPLPGYQGNIMAEPGGGAWASDFNSVFKAYDSGLLNRNTPIYGNSPSSSANGGFLLYPNKANTNAIQKVYAK